MIKRALILVGVVLATVVGVCSPARAYPPGGTEVGTDKSSYLTGTDVVITATGFLACAGSTVTFTITPPGGAPFVVTAGIEATATTAQASSLAPIVVTAIANANGIATVTITAPPTVGTYTVVASSPGCPNAVTSFLVVRNSNISQTGADVQPWLVAGTTAVCAGLGLWLVAARRRRPSTAVA